MPKTIYMGRKDNGSGSSYLPIIIVLSEEESLDNSLKKGLQTQPTTIGCDQPFGQTAEKAQCVTLIDTDNELVKQIKKSFNNA